MNPDNEPNVPAGSPQDLWAGIRRFTSARIGLGRAGTAIPTRELLAFQLAHAQARDAVHAALDFDALSSQLGAHGLPTIVLHSEASDRSEYLRRPDRGRRLDDRSRAALKEAASITGYDLAIVIADGLSASAVATNTPAFLKHFLPSARSGELRIAPLCLVQQGRVAIGDEIGFLLHARAVCVLIGERPGLSSPDSLGIYLTYDPRSGLTDERRNCISNVRAAGLDVGMAARKLFYLVTESLRREVSGVELKDEMGGPPRAITE
jgi:ethanolamine ammonia-lyase small subunit